jgi:hypothetical protein
VLNPFRRKSLRLGYRRGETIRRTLCRPVKEGDSSVFLVQSQEIIEEGTVEAIRAPPAGEGSPSK